MSNLTTQPPAQLSKDGRWRWDGSQWVLVKPRSSRPSHLPGPGAPQHSADGRWWWNGYRWMPATSASSKPLSPRGSGALPKIAIGFGAFAIIMLLSWLFYWSDVTSGGSPPDRADALIGLLTVPLPAAVLGTVLSVLALISAGREKYDRSSRQRMAWGGIATCLPCAALVLWLCLA